MPKPKRKPPKLSTFNFDAKILADLDFIAADKEKVVGVPVTRVSMLRHMIRNRAIEIRERNSKNSV
jgi:hypothetical protein